MNVELDYASMLTVAIGEAREGLAEGGLPIGAAMFTHRGELISSGHNRRVQQDDPSAHADVVMVTTLAPCWYCSGLVRQFGIRTLVVGESRTFSGGVEWLREAGVTVFDLDSHECVNLMESYIREHPEIWHEDIGED
jgi:creatinine deaminase